MSFNFIAFHLLFISCPLLINMYILNFCPYFFFYHCMNKRSEIFPRAMSKWLTNTFFDIDSLLIRILKFNFFFMQFYNKWKWLILLMKTSNVNKNIMSVTCFSFSTAPTLATWVTRRGSTKTSLPTVHLWPTRFSMDEPACSTSNKNLTVIQVFFFFLRTKTNFLSSHLVFPGSTFCSK